jgi:hypothetical protein
LISIARAVAGLEIAGCSSPVVVMEDANGRWTSRQFASETF